MNNPVIGLWVTLFSRYYRTDGCRFYLPRRLVPWGVRARFFFDVYEQEERALVRKWVHSSDRVLELGASIGVVACVTNRLLDESMRAHHLVVEANPFVLGDLWANRDLNMADFRVLHGVLGKGDWRTFYVHRYFFGGSAHLESGYKVPVPVYDLSALCARCGGAFDVLIMDIEGGELEVLEGLGSELSAFRLVLCEFHDFIIGADRVQACRQILQTHQFTLLETMGTVEAWGRAVSPT